jgi:two-component system KDP operon response regulator KdpE
MALRSDARTVDGVPTPDRGFVGSLLVVEDEEPHQRALLAGFASRGYRVDLVPTGAEALDRAEALAPDLAIVDLGLPDMDGLDVCRHLVVRGVCPVIVVTADAVEDRMVAALDLGAVDYVTKPFSMEVLAARVRRVLRSPTESPAPPSAPIECGDLRIDPAAHAVWMGGEAVHLPPLQFSLLAVLARNAGRVMTYQALVRAIHGQGAPPSGVKEGLRSAVSALRRHLGTGPGRPEIRTESRIGYRLVPPEDSDV